VSHRAGREIVEKIATRSTGTRAVFRLHPRRDPGIPLLIDANPRLFEPMNAWLSGVYQGGGGGGVGGWGPPAPFGRVRSRDSLSFSVTPCRRITLAPDGPLDSSRLRHRGAMCFLEIFKIATKYLPLSRPLE